MYLVYNIIITTSCIAFANTYHHYKKRINQTIFFLKLIYINDFTDRPAAPCYCTGHCLESLLKWKCKYPTCFVTVCVCKFMGKQFQQVKYSSCQSFS